MRNCVLVVERDPSVSRFMQLKLEEEGFSCSSVVFWDW